MKKTLTQLALVCLAPLAFGQTDYVINAQAMSWNPNDLTIQMGDSVTWINANNGTHNLNGTTATYPSNPESFSMLTTGSNWTFGKRFNVPGVYLYRCNVHASMMTGKVTVVDPSAGIEENTASTITFGPNPATDIITINAKATDFTVVIYDMAGNRVMSEEMKNQNQLNVSSLTKGTYVIEINTGTSKVQEQFIKN